MTPRTRYGVIIADPPWTYARSSDHGGADRHYTTMAYEQLAALPVPALAKDDSVLLLWATWPKLAEACLPLMHAWGFTYVTGFPWIKVTSIQPTLWGDVGFEPQFGVGYWARGASELVLIGRRGKGRSPDRSFVGLLSPNATHSRKPDSLYEYAEAMDGPYLEMFARRLRPGWDVFGDQVKTSIDIGAYRDPAHATP